MDHYFRDGRVVGWGPTVEEINYLATLFDEINHLAFLHPENAPASALPYGSDKIKLVPVPFSGGNTFFEKLGIIPKLFTYVSKINQELNLADVVHVRCAASLPLLTLIMLIFREKPLYRWVKYAGNWNAGRDYPFFFRFQRWLLKSNLCRCVATVNGKWADQGFHIHSFNNPCITEDELRNSFKSSKNKEISFPIRLIFVGALNKSKGVLRVLKICKILKQMKIPFELDILGDGLLRKQVEAFIDEEKLTREIHLHGWVPKTEISRYYTNAHINIFPSANEGWPKVLSEGMAYGVVPVASAVSSIPQILEETGSGIYVSPFDINAYINAIEELVSSPELWKKYSEKAYKAASNFTYEHYIQAVKNLFVGEWGLLL